jgi:hypothetical protein
MEVLAAPRLLAVNLDHVTKPLADPNQASEIQRSFCDAGSIDE